MGKPTGEAHREAAGAQTSDWANLLRTRALLPLCFDEGNALPLTEIRKRCAFDGGTVEEQILTSARVDEPETAIG